MTKSIRVEVNNNVNVSEGVATSMTIEDKDKVVFIRIGLFENARMKKYRDIVVAVRDDIDFEVLDTLVDDGDLR